MPHDFQNHVNGRWSDARSGARFTRENPATGELTGSYPQSSPDDIADAVCAAREAQDVERLEAIEDRLDAADFRKAKRAAVRGHTIPWSALKRELHLK